MVPRALLFLVNHYFGAQCYITLLYNIAQYVTLATVLCIYTFVYNNDVVTQ